MKLKVSADAIEERVTEILKRPYQWVLIPDGSADGGFHAEIVEFPGCCSCGITWNQAFCNLRDAAKAWVRICLLDGIEIPEPERKL